MWESHPHKIACSVLTFPSAGKCFPFSRSSGSSACDTESAGPCWPGSVTACGAKALLGTASPSTETQHRYSCLRKHQSRPLLGEYLLGAGGFCLWGSAWKFLTSSLSCPRTAVDHPVCRACSWAHWRTRQSTSGVTIVKYLSLSGAPYHSTELRAPCLKHPFQTDIASPCFCFSAGRTRPRPLCLASILPSLLSPASSPPISAAKAARGPCR